MKKFSRLVALALAATMTLTACGAETKPSNKNNGEIVDTTVRKFTPEEKAYDVHYDLNWKR